MLKNEMLEQALKLARLNPNDTKLFNLASDALDRAVRKYSSDSTITDFQRMQESITLGEHSSIGRPVPKKGRRFTCVSELPDITGYDPTSNNFGIIMGKDYYFVGATCYEIQEVTGTTTTYAWVEVDKEDWDDFCDRVPDIVVMDLESILSFTDEKGELIRMDLITYNATGRKERTYVTINEGNGIIRVYANSPKNVTLIYVPELNVNTWQHIDLSYAMQNILTLAVAQEVARTAEMKSDLATRLASAIGSSNSSNAIVWDSFKWGR